MIRASRLKLPPWQPRKPSWLAVATLCAGTVAFWAFHVIVAAVIFSVLAALCLLGLVMSRYEVPRRQALAAQQPPDAMCAFARSFDFRRTDTLVMRAVYEELQPVVPFPIRASHRLIEDLQLDDEDLHFDYVPSIAERVGRALGDAELNPYYGRVVIVADLVNFLAAQPTRESTQKA
ncbi:MAG: hypothetical protein ABR589_01580 [Chthoniobacterales bacterium]